MRSRPWPLVILAAVQALSPVFSILLCSFLVGATPWRYTELLFKVSTPWSLFEFFALGPIAGWVVYRPRSWSYPVFLAVTAYIGFLNFKTWQDFPTYVSVGLLVGIYALNALLVGYFLIPEVRTTFFDPRVRWWETQPRYQLDLDASAGEHPVRIRNISVGGAFLESPETPIEGAFTLSFDWNGEKVELDARVVHRRGQTGGVGVQFVPTRAARKRMGALIKKLVAAGVPLVVEREARDADFRNWLLRLVKTGKGWVPELPQRAPAPVTAMPTSGEGQSGGDSSRGGEEKRAA